MDIDIPNWINLVSIVSAGSIFLPIFMGLFCYRKHSLVGRIVTFFAVISGLFEVGTTYMGTLGIPTIRLIPIWIIVELLCFGIMYRLALSGIWKKIVTILILVFILFSLSDILLWYKSDTYSSILRSVESGVFMFFSLVYFYQLFESLKVRSLAEEPLFWFNTAVLIYFSGNLFNFIAQGYLDSDSQRTLAVLFSIHGFVIIARNILLAIGLWCKLVK